MAKDFDQRCDFSEAWIWLAQATLLLYCFVTSLSPLGAIWPSPRNSQTPSQDGKHRLMLKFCPT